MTAQQSASQLELSVEEFLAGRLELLDIKDVSSSLYQQAGKLRMALTLFNIACATTGIFAFIALFLTTISFADILSGHPDSGNLAGNGAMVVLWLTLLVVCIRGAEVIRHRTWLTRGRRFDISGSDLFSVLFEPLLNGTVIVATLSDNATGIAVTPDSKRPIARYLTRHAFADRALPALLLRNSQNHEGR